MVKQHRLRGSDMFLLHHRALSRKKQGTGKRTASTTGTSDAAGHEGLHAVRQWRMHPLPHRTCASSPRLGGVVNVERKSIPQPLIEKCPRVLSSPGSSVSISLPRSTHMLLLPKNYQLKCENFSAQTRTLLDSRARRNQKGHTQVDTRKRAWDRRKTQDQPITKGQRARRTLPAADSH